MRGRLHNGRNSPMLAKPLQNILITGVALDVGPQFADHLGRVRTADVVALQQHLAATARAHDLATDGVVAGRFVVRTHQQEEAADENRDMGQPLHLPAPAGCSCLASAPALTWTGDFIGAAFGTKASPVPRIRTMTPNQTQTTRGLTIALMIGRCVSGFLPS